MRTLLIALALLAPGLAAAAEWTGATRIDFLYPTADVFVLVTEYRNPQWSSCDGGGRFALNPANPDYDAQIATLLTALAADKTVSLHLEPDQSLPKCAAYVDRFIVFD